MKITMLETPKGRPEYQKGESYEIEEGYARKFIARGWAEPGDKAAEKAAREDRDRRDAEAKAAVEQAEKDKVQAEAKQKANDQQEFGRPAGAQRKP